MRRWNARGAGLRSMGISRCCLLFAVLGLVTSAIAPGVVSAAGPALNEAVRGPATLLAWAESSLEGGGGPAQGHQDVCTAASTGSASCGTPAAVPAPEGNWTEGTGVAPPARELASMAYDPIDQYVVLFGGCGYTCSMNDTWTFSNGTWTNLTGHTTNTPPGRSSATMAWDGQDDYVVMFGGINASGFLQDTWGFVGGKWVDLLPAQGGFPVPAPRFGGSMAYDATDGYLLLFGGGGFYQDRTLLNDTWKFYNGRWTHLYPVNSPSIRAYAAMDFDASSGKILLFGGEENTIFSGDTWTYTAGNWTHLILTKAPSPRQGAALVYDSALGGSILYGGMSKFGFVNDTWFFHLGVWTPILLGSEATPPPRTWFGSTYDAADQEVIIEGGWSLSSLYGDYWGFGNSTSI
jgi:hypothetical protein